MNMHRRRRNGNGWKRQWESMREGVERGRRFHCTLTMFLYSRQPAAAAAAAAEEVAAAAGTRMVRRRTIRRRRPLTLARRAAGYCRSTAAVPPASGADGHPHRG